LLAAPTPSCQSAAVAVQAVTPAVSQLRPKLLAPTIHTNNNNSTHKILHTPSTKKKIVEKLPFSFLCF